MNAKVLIVDDNSSNLCYLETLLRAHGWDVISAANGEEALAKARLDLPDMIVADILMPVMDGYTLCQQWKSDDRLKQIPFVFYTATYTEARDEAFALRLGAERFLIKPLGPEILMNQLMEVLGKSPRAGRAAAPSLGEDAEFFRGHDEILFKKLEKKMLDLEIANQKWTALEEKYRLIFENMTDIIFRIDADFTISAVSPSVERVLGYGPQDFIGHPVSDLARVLGPDSFPRALDEIRSVFSGETISATTYRLIAKDGSIVAGEVSGAPMRREGVIVGVIAVARDITKRRQAEEDLRESEKKYHGLFDFLPIPVYEMDFEANITAANRAMIETFRGTREDLEKGFRAWQLLSPEGIAQSRENIQRLLKGESLGGTEYLLRRLDGSVFPAIVFSRVVYSFGRPTGLLGAIVDMTERQKAEEDLRRMNAFLDSIVENIPNMIFIKDAKELRFVRYNRAGEELLGYSREDLLGKNDYDFFPREQADFFAAKDREVLRGRELVEIPEEPLQTRAKGERVLHTKKVPILSADGEPAFLLGISEDITERKEVERALLRTVESLKKAVNTTIRVMVSAVEARDPYTAGHQIRSAHLACAIAAEMGLPQDKIEGIRLAASIHDIGKMSIPAEILSKPTKLTAIEFALIKEHAKRGYEILKTVESSWPLAEIAYQHHERIDGSGYPRSLKGDEILIEARILGVADVIESMASHRPYRPALGIQAALDEIVKNQGILYDPGVAEACLRLFGEKGYQLTEA
ncbi:MAG: PAS domain S-box protein [Candidatus Aminicenantes bacterium]|nr:PAS domain S-box protein [Candidatus Aminicenantes bacterium]